MFLLRFLLSLFPRQQNSIDIAFTKQFESEVHLAYQRFGSKLLNTVRRKTNVVGKSTTFQIIGKGIAGTKTRGGQVPILNLVHTNVECILADRYGGEFIDKLDELNKALILLYLDNHGYKEISYILGITETNVATKINRIKQKLKKDFAIVENSLDGGSSKC